MINAGVSLGVLGKTWEYLGDHFNGITFGLPATAAGYPEFLEEMKWETDWLLKMQAADGSVYDKISTNAYGPFEMPELELTPRYYVPYGTAETADFTAMMAQASRLFAPYDPAYSLQCLAAARVSYAYLTANPTNVTANQSGFPDTYGTTDSDDRLWAAAEMWETTGESGFLNDFETRAGSGQISYSMDWADVTNLGMFTYYMSARTGKNPALVNNIKNSILSTANGLVSTDASHGYGRCLGTQYWWGVNGAVAREALTLFVANRISPDQDYINTAQDILNYLFGRNSYCRSFVTQLGYNPPQHPHHRPSGAQGKAWPGYMVGGPWAWITPTPGQTPLPASEQWLDVQADDQVNEVAINWNSALVFALAMQMRDVPTLTPTITGTPPTSTVTPTITQTGTITQTWTISETFTVSPTATITPTIDVNASIGLQDYFTYPNPSAGRRIIFRYPHTGFVDKVKIRIFTIISRKVAEINATQTNDAMETVWAPASPPGNGLYFYILELSDRKQNTVRKYGTFVVLRNLIN